MKRKIFIAVNLPSQTKRKISKATEDWHDLPMRWTKEEHYHLTLNFIGYVQDEDLIDICEKVREVAQEIEFFEINFTSIELAPTADNPRMLWLRATASEEFQKLGEKIGQAIGVPMKSQKKSSPHITLGRIKRIRWKKLPENPANKKEFFVSIPIETIDVMASELTKQGLEYFIIKSCSIQ